jgi:hypothetical protein
MFRMISESMLANVIAFEEAGVPRQELNQVVGRDGGTITGRGVMFQTPIAQRLSEEDGELLFGAYSKLAADYNAGHLHAERIDRIKGQNNVHTKTGVIRMNLRGRYHSI